MSQASQKNQVILPGATLGVMGGGQLGRMFVHAAQRMGYFTAVLDPDVSSPAGRVSHHHVLADYLDAKGLAQLGAVADAITTEFENVPAPALEALARQCPVAPAASAVAIAQDRTQEKAHFVRCGVACAPYAVIDSAETLAAVDAGLLPGILKTSRMGYDGKGQVRVADRAALKAAWAQLRQVPCVLEKMLPLAAECSVIVARGRDGQIVNFPPQRNLHREGILAVTEVYEGNLPPVQSATAVEAAKSIANGLDYVGVLCVEFFVLTDGALVVNEIAPRPHNSGHYTMDACDESQFDLQVRTLAGLPLTQPRQHSPSIMLKPAGRPVVRRQWRARASCDQRHAAPPGPKCWRCPACTCTSTASWRPKPDARWGHINVTGASIEAVRATALQACQLLGLEPF